MFFIFLYRYSNKNYIYLTPKIIFLNTSISDWKWKIQRNINFIRYKRICNFFFCVFNEFYQQFKCLTLIKKTLEHTYSTPMKLIHRLWSKKFKPQLIFCNLIARICKSNSEICKLIFYQVLWQYLNGWANFR